MLERARAGRHALLVAATGAGKTLAGFLPTICELARAGRGAPHPLHLAAEGAGGRRPAQPARPDRRDGAADPGRDPHRRHAVRPQGAAARAAAAGAADHARILSLLLSYPDSFRCSPGSRPSSSTRSTPSPRTSAATCSPVAGAAAAIAPDLRRVGLSATVADPDAYRSWLAPDADMDEVDVVLGDPGAEPELDILIPETASPGRATRAATPRAGHGRDREAQDDPRLLQHARPCRADLPGPVEGERARRCRSASTTAAWRSKRGARSRRRWPTGGCGRWSAPPASTSASTGATSTSSSRWARPRAARACCSGSAAPTTGSTSRARHHRARQPLRISRSPRRARRGRRGRARSRDLPPRHARHARPAHPRLRLRRAVRRGELLAEIRSAAPYAGLSDEIFERVLSYIATGGYALRAYDKFRRLVEEPAGSASGASPSPTSPSSTG
jgi:ATP-dependent Lhr-like helicase